MADIDSFEKAFEQYSKRIYTYCFKMVRNSDIAQELMQDAFIRLFQRHRLDLYDDSISNYLYRIAHNLCIDYIRKESRFKCIKQLLTNEDNSTSIEEQVTKNYYSEEVEKCLNVLNPIQRSIVILHAVEGLSHSQIASILNKNEAAIRKQYQRSKEKIKSFLEKEGVMINETSRAI